MIAVGTDLLVYARRREARLGDATISPMRNLAEGDRAWVIH